jgi:hypothetical protein
LARAKRPTTGAAAAARAWAARCRFAVREDQHPIAAVVVDGEELLALGIDLNAGDVAELRLRAEHVLRRFGDVVREAAGRPVVHQQRVAVFVAEDHLVVDRIQRDAVECRKRIGHRPDRRDEAADRAGRPVGVGDAALPWQLRRTLRPGVVDAVLGEQLVDRRGIGAG